MAVVRRRPDDGAHRLAADPRADQPAGAGAVDRGVVQQVEIAKTGNTTEVVPRPQPSQTCGGRRGANPKVWRDAQCRARVAKGTGNALERFSAAQAPRVRT